MPPTRRFAPLLLLPLVLLLFWRLSYAPFWNPDEGRYAAASLEMASPLDGSTPDWLVPHLDTVPRLNKPPLVYWLAGSFFRVFGPVEWAGRLAPALAGLGVLLILFLWARAGFGLRAGLAAALVWSTAMFPFAMARVLNTDMLLCFSITLTMYGLWHLLETPQRIKAILLAGAGMGLALLSKGPVGLALPLLIGGLYSAVTFRGRRVPWGALAASIAVGLCIGLPWYLAVQTKRPDFLRHFLVDENAKRFSGGKAFHDRTPPWFYLPVLLAGLMPWTGFALGLFSRWTRGAEEKRAHLFLCLWACFIVGFFSLSGTKLISYALPAFPPLALLAGAALSRWENWAPWRRRTALGITLTASFVLIVAIAVLPGRDKASGHLGWKPGVLLDDRILPAQEGLPHVIGLAIVLGVGSGALILAARRGRALPVIAAHGGTAAALYLCLAPLAGHIARYEDGSAVFTALMPYLKSDDRVIAYQTFVPSGIFYFHRPITHFDFKNTSGLSEAELKKSPYFLDSEKGQLAGLLAAPGRALVLTRGRPDPSVAGMLKYWGRNNDFFLWSNRDKPQGFSFDFVAPLKREHPTIPGRPATGP